MTTQECDSRDRRMVDNICFVMRGNPVLHPYATTLQISIENASVVLRGELPSSDLKEQLVPIIRQAGVLCRITDCIRVAS